jgi:eukaryotic-like serine/threonine-protein kinase
MLILLKSFSKDQNILRAEQRIGTMKTRMYLRRKSLFGCTSLLLLFTLFLAACGGTSTPAVTPTPGQTVTPTTGTTPTTVPMPPAQTSCPPAATARGAVTAPLVRGSHANVVYVSNQGQEANPISGTIKRYDMTTRSETVIVTVPHAFINDAQVSADGQWVLFSTYVSNRPAIQLVRMDGQGLQTLYCSVSDGYSGASALEWSPDQKYLAFKEGSNVYLLNVATGAYKLEVPSSNGRGYVPRTWLDNTHLYMTPFLATETPPLILYLLDISNAKVQQVLNSPALCGDFDSSIDGTQLFTSECVSNIPTTEGPSSIKAQPATGGPATTIYSTPTYGITKLRVASRNTLLFVIYNTGVGSIDTSHNGLWKINTDGTGLTRLTTEAAGEATLFNLYTQYFWSTVSRDGAFYAVQVINYSSSADRPTSVLIGPMSGGAPFTLAKGTANTGEVHIAGWTTM